MSVYEKNLARLRKIYPQFQSDIVDAYSPDPELTIAESRSGVPTASYMGRYLHSRHDPRREAERLITSVCGSSGELAVFLGFGLGYQVEAFIAKFPGSPVLIIEKEPSLFLKAIAVRDCTSFLTDQVSLSIGIEARDISGLVSHMSAKQFRIVPLSPLLDIFEEYYRDVQAILQSRLSRQQVNAATLRRFGRRWTRNLADNLEIMNTARDAGEWRDRLRGLPAVVVAAGPSLDEVLPFMPEIAERSVVISSDTAARALLKTGVVPDFIIVVDPQYWNSRHLDGLDLSNCILISESATHPDVFRHDYLEIFFSGSVFPLGSFLEGEDEGRYRLGAGGSVATTAWDFARFTGADPILTAGLDLGFPDSRPHFRGCYFEERLFSVNCRTSPYEHLLYRYMQGGDPFQSENFDGNPVTTDRRLIVYKQWFEEQLSYRTAVSTRSLSRRGIRIEGMDLFDPQDVLSWSGIREHLRQKLEEVLQHRPSTERSSYNRLDILLKDLKQLKDTALRGIRLTEGILKSLPSAEDSDITEQLQQLDELDRSILQVSGRQVAAFLLTPLLDEIERTHKPASDLSSVLKISLRLYREILSSSEYHLRLFSNYTVKK